MKKDQAFSQDFDNAERIGYLIASYIKGTLTPLERKELDGWILASEENELLFDELTSEENIQSTLQWYSSLNEEKARQQLQKRISFTKARRKIISLPLATIAASVILIMGIAVFYLWQKNNEVHDQNSSNVVAISEDASPGKDKAVLTLASGKIIVLDSAAGKKLGEENISVSNGTLFYKNEGSYHPQQNILTVPRGAQYKVVLADGTKVWLNAESSLTYPTAFTGNERKVTLTGEGYFEVTKNKEKPFIVESSGNQIKVLGTQFNINSYADENIFAATLVEGSVQISRGDILKILKPGEQARVTAGKIDIAPVNTAEATGWKDGEFVFRDAAVPSIVKQLARWYNLDIDYPEPVEKHLNATIKRDVPLSKVLHYLEATGDVHFKLEGRKLIVLK
jgi:ferric-dicitrate binding protein FerR (iron transport regulator)